ncbi:MAG: methionine gamma-lyase family protein [Clostridia bacterium]|jgi:cystathionine beta-lyase family protein involved in aluminum resistance|nr:methionine gamma-lyase family protein [Clostridia bacterium]
MFEFNEALLRISDRALAMVQPRFRDMETIAEHNQQKVLRAFIENKVSEAMFAPTTGYGHSDWGRETLERVFAQAFDAEDALVRHHFSCGTHTLAVALFGVLRPGDTMLCVTGTPYDTIRPVIGITEDAPDAGSLRDFGIRYDEVALDENGKPDFAAMAAKIRAVQPKMVYIQRSRGYSLRDTVSIDEIARMVKIAKENSSAVVMVDNCYGEFTETREPTSVGADLIAGSMIKNPGGGIAKTGGYIAGRADLIEKCANRLSTPGLGKEIGATLGHTREMFMGFFQSPHIVGEALKTACYTAALFELLGFETTPRSDETRHDIIQAICLKNKENLIAFCRGLQRGSAIDSFVVPEPSEMPGYDCEVVMAGGSFTNGSTIELSADAPLREPFAVWFQGSLNFHSAKPAVLSAAEAVLREQNRKEG